MGVLLWGVSVMQSQIFYGARRTLAIGIVTVAAAVLNLVLNVLLVPVWGITGSAFSTLVCYLLSCAVLFRLGRGIAKLDFYWLHILKCIMGAVVMGLVLRVMNAWASPLYLSLLAGALTYAIALWLLRAIAPVELELVRNFLRVPSPVSE
jgi:O-antigen/teichoic acid export membrane protein